MALAQNVGGIFQGMADVDAANKAAERLRQMGIEPNFSDLDYESAAYSGDFSPEMFGTPEAAQYETVGEDPRVRQMQMDALQTLVDRASGASDAKMNAAQFGAMDEANQLAQGREGAIKQEMQRKGQGGSGFDAIMRANASQSAANRARAGSQDAVMNAALEKLQAQNSMLSGAGNVRGQDFQRAAANSDIINKFNMFNTQARNAANQANTGMRNQAGMRNLGARQGYNEGRAGASNRSLDRKDRLAGAKHDAKMQRFAAENQIGNQYRQGIGDTIASGAAAGQDIISSISAGAQSGGGGYAKKRPEDDEEWV